MGRVIRFTIPGPPMGKPTMKRSDRWRKRPNVQRYWAWCDLARMCAKSAGLPGDANLVRKFSITAYFVPPESKQERIGRIHRQKPDASNILKAAEDALFKRDEGLGDVHSRKFWARVSRLEVEVELIGDDDGERV